MFASEPIVHIKPQYLGVVFFFDGNSCDFTTPIVLEWCKADVLSGTSANSPVERSDAEILEHYVGQFVGNFSAIASRTDTATPSAARGTSDNSGNVGAIRIVRPWDLSLTDASAPLTRAS